MLTIGENPFRYSLVMTGPWDLAWYRKRGLTEMALRVINTPEILARARKATSKPVALGDMYEDEIITFHYAKGFLVAEKAPEIPGELSRVVERAISSPMRMEDWNQLSQYLKTFTSTNPLEVDNIINMFERDTDTKIRWADAVD